MPDQPDTTASGPEAEAVTAEDGRTEGSGVADGETQSHSAEGGALVDDVDPDESVPLEGHDLTTTRSRSFLLAFREEEAETLSKDQYSLETRYWLNRPFAYAAIFRDETTNELTYRVVEPDLDEHEAKLYQDLENQLTDRLLYQVPADEDIDRAATLEAQAREVVQGLAGFNVADPSFEKVLYYLHRNLLASRYGRIDPLMQDPHIEEISADGPGVCVYTYHREYENLATNIVYEEDELDRFIHQIAQRAGNDISTAHPTEGMSLPDGSRVQLSLDDISPRGANYTVRKHAEDPFTPVELIDLGTFSVDQMAYLWLLIENGYSGLITGGTGSGKTATLNALTMFIPPGQKVVSLEDTRELQIPQDNLVSLLTREGYAHEAEAEIGMYDLLENALRKRPEYLIVGEVRGKEARDMFQAMNTGHTTFSTVHADSLESAFSRLLNEPMAVERPLVSELGFLAVQTKLNADGSDEGARRTRRNQSIYEIKRLDPDTNSINHRRVYEWDEASDTINQVADSYHRDSLREQGRDPDESFEARRRLLSHLVDEGITEYEHVATAIRSFMRAPGVVSKQVERGELDFDALEDL